MPAAELPLADPVEEPADQLTAAKEKSGVEDTSGETPAEELDEDEAEDDFDDDDDDDEEEAVDFDDDDSDDDGDDEAEEAPAEEEADAEDGDDDDDDLEDDDDDDDLDDDDEADEAEEDDASARLGEHEEGQGAIAEAIAPAAADTIEDRQESTEIEQVVAEPVAVPIPVIAPAPPQITEGTSSDHVQHLRLLEALLFAGTQALGEQELADRLPNDADLPRLLADLAELYANRGINLVKVAGGYAFRTAPDLSEKLKIERPVTRKLSRASVETLAIIAFHQPVTRAEIEQVRGVGLSKGTLDLLFEQNWIKPMGRRRAPGKPVTWGTTDFFLEHFGLGSLDDLPGHEEMRAAGLLDARAQPPIFRPEEADLPLEPTDDEADEPLAAEEKGADRATGPQ